MHGKYVIILGITGKLLEISKLIWRFFNVNKNDQITMSHCFTSSKQQRVLINSFRTLKTLIVIALLTGCANPITVEHVDIHDAYQNNRQNSLSTGQPSEYSKIVLRRLGLLDQFDTKPEDVLTKLHRQLTPDSEHSLFALAELSFLYADRTQDNRYFMASAIYAWAFLFPEDKMLPHVHPSNPRYRLAYDLYNQALAKGLRLPKKQGGVDEEVNVKSDIYRLPFGTLKVTLDESGMLWGGYRLNRFIPTTTMEVDGLRNRYLASGLGASMAAGLSKELVSNKAPASNRLDERHIRVPVTLLLRFNDVRNALAQNKVSGILEVYPADQTSEVMINGREQPLESDTSAALAYQLNDSPYYSLEIAGFLTGGMLEKIQAKNLAKDGLLMMHPYKPGKIPIVLVHGTASSPVRWAELFNELQGDPKIRDKFQVWAFVYDSGNPILYSAGKLKKALAETLKELDPKGQDPALAKMVVIGHSQGGLLTKLMAVDSGSRFWDMVSSKPFSEIKVSAETHNLIEQSLFYKPLPFVKRVIYIATPHHGAIMAAWQWVSGLAFKLITLPVNVLNAIAETATWAGDAGVNTKLIKPQTAIDTMNPNNDALKVLAAIPNYSGIRAHSIIAVKADEPVIEDGDDGVVAYKSAHINDSVSELVVRSGHSCQGKPEVIEEIRRILYEHLKDS